MSESDVVSLSEFARLQGWRPSYVTKLKQAGRLVLNDNGRVNVEASRARIAATADPNRDDVRARHAAGRADGGERSDPQQDRAGQSFATSRAVKERYLALTAKLEYEQRAGKLVEVEAVQRAGAEAGGVLRAALENLPDQLAPILAEGDPDRESRIYAQLREHVERLLEEISRKLDTLTRVTPPEKNANG